MCDHSKTNLLSTVTYFMIYIYISMDTMKKSMHWPVTGRQHNSQGLNLFFLHMLLGASLVQQKGRLQEKKTPTHIKIKRTESFVFSFRSKNRCIYTHIQYKT